MRFLRPANVAIRGEGSGFVHLAIRVVHKALSEQRKHIAKCEVCITANEFRRPADVQDTAYDPTHHRFRESAAIFDVYVQIERGVSQTLDRPGKRWATNCFGHLHANPQQAVHAGFSR
jgi:hypothetical protein